MIMQLHVLGFVTSYLYICHFLTLIAADNLPLNRNVTLVQADASFTIFDKNNAKATTVLSVPSDF